MILSVGSGCEHQPDSRKHLEVERLTGDRRDDERAQECRPEKSRPRRGRYPGVTTAPLSDDPAVSLPAIASSPSAHADEAVSGPSYTTPRDTIAKKMPRG